MEICKEMWERKEALNKKIRAINYKRKIGAWLFGLSGIF
jgi:hypothetical protein